jgi:hypothetical protein
MIVKKNILATINDFDNRYNEALLSPNSKDSIYISKLAILEYCGWIEDSLDKIVRRSVSKKIKTLPFKQMLDQRIIGNNYGFLYKENFRPMMLSAIGIVKMESLERKIDSDGHLEILISQLESVKKNRDSAAHTWVNEVLPQYQAPSSLRSKIEIIHPILKNIYSYIIK